MATTALPGGRNCRHRRLRTQWNRRGQWGGTLMRHFLRFGPIPALVFGVCMTASVRRLIAATGGLNGDASCLVGTPCGAVAVTPIAVTADDHGGAATRTQIASSRKVHGQKRANGGRQRRPLRGILGMQRCPSGQRGAASELAWRLVPVSRRHRHRLRCYLPHRSHRRYRLVQHHHPRTCRTAFARRLFAPQTARREPCGQPAKTTIDKLNRQNLNRCP